MIMLLRARDRVYDHAKRLQGIYVTLTVLLGVIGIVSPSEYKPFFGLAGILALLADVGFLEQRVKDLCKLGARLGEDFDLFVLKLPRNAFATDKPVAPEDVHRYGAAPLNPKREEELRGWYERCVAQVPLPAGRLICQRTNVTYDARLRTRYAGWLLAAVVAFAVLLLFAGLALKLAWADVISAFGAALPALNWALREGRKNLEVATQLDKLKGEIESLWARVLAGEPDHEIDTGSRQLQDAIFKHRAATTLIFGWVYARMRSNSEQMTSHVARHLVDEFQRRRAAARAEARLASGQPVG